MQNVLKATPRRAVCLVHTSSRFRQLLHHFPRLEFASLVKKHHAERDAKGFSYWTQMVVMRLCQSAYADSLLDIVNGVSCCAGKLAHSGIGTAANKSTRSYANGHRRDALFENLFWTVLEHFRSENQIGVLKLRPEEVRHQGAGQLLGRVFESDVVETLALNGGFTGLFAVMKLAMAMAVLALGAAGLMHAALLLGWVIFSCFLGWRHFQSRRGWSETRLAMTHDVVERLREHPVMPHAAEDTKHGWEAIEGKTTRNRGPAISQRPRKRSRKSSDG